LVSDVLLQLKKIVCFSDSTNTIKTSGTYIRRNVHVAAKWNFFATLHGRSPCIGIDGTVMHMLVIMQLRETTF
jgi:hypothetical protein